MVQTDKGVALQGVSVSATSRAAKKTLTTTTDEKGLFLFNGLQTGAVYDFFFSYVGYETNTVTGMKIRTGNDNTLLVRMIPSAASLDEVVVVGYGTQAKRDVTTSIAMVNEEEINNYPSLGPDKALVGKMAGVQVLEQTGAPGSGIAIKVRGTSTVTAGTMPLYVIDGVPMSDQDDNGPARTINSLNDLNMNDIESIEVLKDASAAAIYGSRGSNGVVMITTKRGKKGKPVLSYNAFGGWQQTTKEIAMLDAYQYAQFLYDSHNNAYLDALADAGMPGSIADGNDVRKTKVGNSSSYLIPPDILPYLNKEPGLVNTNWQDQVLRKALLQSHSLSVRGGSDNISYYLSGNYMDQEGIAIGSDYKKYNGRLNLDANYSKLKIGTTINITNSVSDWIVSEDRFNSEAIISSALAMAPNQAVYNADGSYNFNQYNIGYSRANVVNPVALAKLKSDVMNQIGLMGNVFAQYQLPGNLVLKSSFALNLKDWREATYRPSTLPSTSTLVIPSVPSATSQTKRNLNWVTENTLSWKKNFGGHSISAVAGFTAQKEHIEANNIKGTGYQNDLVQTLNNATTITSWSSTVQEWSLVSALARVQYNYQGKYLLSAAFRSDGSSRFGPSSKWGTFPSVSAGWNIGQENFMRKWDWISALKLRASYGVTGNFSIGNYGYLSLISSDNYILGTGSGSLAPGYIPSTSGNSNLKWEKNASTNLGMDMSFWNNQVSLQVDVYNANTSNMLLQVPVPSTSGFTTALRNVGKVNNRGIEITLSTNHRIGSLRMTHNLNFSANRNRVIDLGGLSQIVSSTDNVLSFITKIGHPIASYYTLVTNGVYKDWNDVNNPKNPVVPGARPGDLRFVDENKDGVIDGNDMVATGNYQPKFTYGYSTTLSYGIFDLSFALQGVYGNKIANIYKRYIDGMDGNANNMTDALHRWESPANPGDGRTMRADRVAKGMNGTISTWHIEDGSYLRIRNIAFGVSLPRSLIKGGVFSRVRLYIMLQNPFTFTGYSGYNPEVNDRTGNPLTPGVDYGTYPLAKSYNLGLNVDF